MLPRTDAPSTRPGVAEVLPATPTSTGVDTCSTTSVCTVTAVSAVKAGGWSAAMARTAAVRSCATPISSTNTGTASAESLSQYWNAWTNVIERIPPNTTLITTTMAIRVAPTQPLQPVSTDKVSPAPWNCGTR